MRKTFNNIINKNWIEWFIGFCDADGNFQVFPKKRSYVKKSGISSDYFNIGYGFHVSLNFKDFPLLQKAQVNLSNIGHIYEYPLRDEARFSVTKLIELNYLIENVLDVCPLISEHQRKRFALFKYGILNKVNRVETMEDYKKILYSKYNTSPILDNYYTEGTAFDNWILGFINGEGCFHFSKRGHLVFYIEHTDKNCLMLIKKRLDLSPNILDRGNRKGTRQNTYSLFISSQKDLINLIKLIENPLLNGLEGYKLIQYNNWIQNKPSLQN